MMFIHRLLVILFLTFCLIDTPCLSQDYTEHLKCPRFTIISAPGAWYNGIQLNDGSVFIPPSDVELELFSCNACYPEFKYNGQTYIIASDFKPYSISNYKTFTSAHGIVVINGKYGLVDRGGDPYFMLEPKYDYIEGLKGYFVKVKKDGKYALFNVQTKQISPFEFDDVKIVKKGKFNNFKGLTHYYVKKKTKFGWQYTSLDVYKETPTRLFEDTILYYGLGGIIWDSIP